LHKNIVESLKHQDKVKPDAQISVASSGTGGGMSKFCADEIDIVGVLHVLLGMKKSQDVKRGY
jgi:phosphate transport system substrate-binding protein